MNITLTGATGFIGQRLVNRLLSEHHQLTLLTRNPRNGSSPRYLVWDSRKDIPPAEAFQGCEAVIHLAGEPVARRWTPEVKQRIRDSRVDGTRRLVQALAASASKPATLISASAIGIYGSRGDEELTESSAPGQGFLEDVSADWEREASAAEDLGIRVVRVRIGVVLGHGGALSKMLPAFRAGVGGRLGSGRQWMSWIHVDDLIEMIVFALQNESLRGPVNGTAPYPVTNQEFTKTLASTVRRAAIFPVPGFVLKVLFGEMSSVLLGGQKVIPEAATQAGFRFRYPRLKPALAQILTR